MTEEPVTVRRPEVQVAAAWWADRLANPGRQDNGDGFQSGFATMAMLSTMMRVGPLTADEKALFTERLATRLEAHVSAGWDEAIANPGWGSYVRAIGVDYGPDRILQSALFAAVGLTRAEQFALMWPIKTIMWINPGEVKVALGYGAEPVVIYPEQACETATSPVAVDPQAASTGTPPTREESSDSENLAGVVSPPPGKAR